MAKYKVGDRVRIVGKWVSGKQACDGEMNHWLGKVMTVRTVGRNGWYKMEEDKSEYGGDGWFWDERDIAGLAPAFKVGDRVISHSDGYGITKKGWIGIVTKVYDVDGRHYIAAKGPGDGPGRGHEITFSALRVEDFDLYHYDQKIVVTTDGKITEAKLYEGNKCVKIAKAKLSEKDAFSFETGAALAVDRLLGREKKESKEPAPVPFNKSMLTTGRFGRVANCRKGDGWFVVVGERLIYEDGGFDHIDRLNGEGAFTAGGVHYRPIEYIVEATSFNNAKCALKDKPFGAEIVWARKG